MEERERLVTSWTDQKEAGLFESFVAEKVETGGGDREPLFLNTEHG